MKRYAILGLCALGLTGVASADEIVVHGAIHTIVARSF